MDSHLALANTAALQLAGVGPDTPDPEEGIVDKDAETGQPTGILRYGAEGGLGRCGGSGGGGIMGFQVGQLLQVEGWRCCTFGCAGWIIWDCRGSLLYTQPP